MIISIYSNHRTTEHKPTEKTNVAQVSAYLHRNRQGSCEGTGARMWLNGVQPTTKGKKRINRSVVAHNVAYAAQQANKSDPFAGRRARSHMLNGHLTPQDVQAGSY